MDLADSTPQPGEEPVLEKSENASSRPFIAQSNKKIANYTANALDSTRTVFHGSGIQHSGHGHLNVQGNVNITSNPPPNSEEIEKCMQALFLTDPSEDREMLKRKKGRRASGTCEWILDTKKLNDWLHLEETEQKSHANGVLWLHGNPGTGKSTMAIYLTEKLSTVFDAVKNMTLAYFFCDAGFENRKTATSIIRGLLYQLVQRHRDLLLNYVLPRYKERGDQLFTSFDALWTVFIAAAADQDTGRKYFIIDALDECDNDSKDTLLYQLHETFLSQGNTPPNLSILITSRPYLEIREYLQDFINADLASFDQARQDIDICIRERVDDLAKRKHYTDKIKREIIEILRDKAEGTFLWVGLACEELRGKPSKDATRFLRKMPKGLTSLYKSLLKTAIEDEAGECLAIQRILSFVAISFKALSVLQLSEACQLHQDEPDMDTRLQYTRDQIASCRLLVVVHDEEVQLLHQSVRDFLTGSGSDFFVERLEAHANAASCCIDSLIKRLHGKNPSGGPFLGYAMKYWTGHVREAAERFKICEPQIPFFESNSNSMRRWMRLDARYTSGSTFLHVALDLGLPILVEYALGMREVHPIMGGPAFNIKNDLNPLHGSDLSPFSVALRSREIDRKTQAEMVNLLIKASANVTRRDINLAIFVYWVDQEVVLSLLDHMNQEDRTKYIQQHLRLKKGRENKFTPLILAKYGDQITVDDDMVRDTVLSSNGGDILPLLLDQRRGQIAITEDIIQRAARNEGQGRKLVEFLLDYHRDRIFITEDIMKIAAANTGQGGELVEFLLNYQGDQILITEDIILAAMRNERQGKQIIRSLSQQQSGKIKIKITTNILEEAVLQKYGREFLELLLRHREDQPIVTITFNMLYFGAVNHGRARETISLIFKKFGNLIQRIDHVMMIAVKRLYRKEEFIEFLIQNGGTHIVITDEIVETVLDTNSPGYEHRIASMGLFFKHRHRLKFTGKALATIIEFGKNQISESKESKKRKISEYEEEHLEEAGEFEEPLLEE